MTSWPTRGKCWIGATTIWKADEYSPLTARKPAGVAGLSPPEYYIPPPTVQADAWICDCLRARQEAVVGCGRVPRTPHPASDGRDLKRSRAIAPALPWAIMCAALKINPPAGCRFHTRCPWAIDECSRTKPQLQEIEPNHFASCIRINTNQPDIGAVAV